MMAHLLARGPALVTASVAATLVWPWLAAAFAAAAAALLVVRAFHTRARAQATEIKGRAGQVQDLNAQLEISNEELQTSKEELEAANEELMLLNADLEARNRDLAMLYNIAHSLNQSLDLDALITAALDRLRAGFPPETCAHVVFADEESGAALDTAISLCNCHSAKNAHRGDARLCEFVLGRMANDVEQFRVADLLEDPATRDLIADKAENGSCVGVPLRLRGESRLGALVLVSRSGHQFTEQEVWLYTSVAQALAAAVSNARLFENLKGTLEDLRRTQDQLLRTEKLRSLGELAAGVAHDFNNVLGIILGNAQYLLEAAAEEPVRDGLRAIEQAAKDGARTVERIQGFVTAKGVEGFTEVDLNAIVRELLQIARTRLKPEDEFRGVHVEIKSVEGAVEPVLGDERELREALTNVVFNAIDAMPEGGTLTIETGREDDAVFVRITDTGVGMPPEVKSRIFDPFFTTKGVEGTGLGLSVTYGIVNRHRGTISVESEPGRGTSVTIALPVAEQAPREAPEPEAAPAKGRAVRVLIIDDNVELTRIMQDILIGAGHQVEIAHDGGAGLDAFHQGHHELVITDIGMPGMSGWDVAQAVKQGAPGTGVILVTGWGKPAYQNRIDESGVDALLPKPVDKAKLLRVLNQVASKPVG
jgi:signal transduction histidine kinase/CheY-like chemotaxis protein